MFTNSTFSDAVKRVLDFANGQNGKVMSEPTSQPTNGHPQPPTRIPEGPSIETVASAACSAAEVLSPSQVNCWLDCPAKWYYRYQVRLPEIRNSNLGLGTAVDEALAWQFSEKARTREDKPASEVQEAFDHYWAEQAAEVEFASEDDPEQLRRLGRALVERYMEELAPDVQPALIDGAPAVQHKVAGEIAGVKVHGYIDVVTEDGVVIDLKTAGRKPGQMSIDYRLQLTTYDILCAHSRGQARLEYMIKTKIPKTHRQSIDIGVADIKFAESVYPMAQEGMRDGLYPPRRNSNLCSRKYCSFWQRCEEDFGGTVE